MRPIGNAKNHPGQVRIAHGSPSLRARPTGRL
jgi:hypothetical protein